MSGEERRIVEPSETVRGEVHPPGDKSISHRAAMLSAAAGGRSRIRGFLRAEDCLHTLGAVSALGAAVHDDGETIEIEGVGGAFRSPERPLDLGNSGTGLRLLCGLLAGRKVSAELTGDVSLRSRPMRRIRDPLAAMGARIELLGADGCAPVRVEGGGLHGIEYDLPVASAQVKSAVLLAGLSAAGRTTVREARATRDHTERMLSAMGAAVRIGRMQVSVDGAADGDLDLEAGTWCIPGDFSSAAFWMAAAAGREGCEVRLTNVGLNPGRTAFIDVLRRMGADVAIEPAATEGWEPRGDVVVRGARLRGIRVAGADIPNMIDELPLVAVLGALAEGTTEIRDAAELRVKESDRIAAMVAGLAAMRVSARELADGLEVNGGGVRGGVEIDSRGDHRVAMAFAVLALHADEAVTLHDVACVATSYPSFWEDLRRLSSGG